MKKTKEEFINAYNVKISYLRKQLEEAKKTDVSSEIRGEYANNIAVILRALLCRVSRTDSLCKNCGYDNFLLFPFKSPISALNILPTYSLVAITVCDGVATFCADFVSLPKDNLFTMVLSYTSWLEEIVIDFKTEDLPPISRQKLIRLVADRMGAHVDSDYDPYLLKIAMENVMPITICSEKGEVKGFGHNLFTESILAIAEEFLMAESLNGQLLFRQRKSSSWIFYLQKFENGSKYVLSKIKINPYNSNKFFNCEYYSGKIYDVQVLYGKRMYEITVIDNNCKVQKIRL